jgi:hypothetical protein
LKDKRKGKAGEKEREKDIYCGPEILKEGMAFRET